MQRGLHCAVEFLRKYLPGVLAAVFILVAALTWGIRAGADVATATEEEWELALTAWSVVGLLLRELAFMAALPLAALHPFGCALCALLLGTKSFLTGFSWGWWCAGGFGFWLFLLLLLPQGLLATFAYAAGACCSSYAALRISPLTPQEYWKNLICCLLCQIIAVLMRCLACAWAGA